MKLFDRTLVLFVSIFWFILSIFFFRVYWLAFLPLLGLVFVFIGGRRHV